MKNDNFQILQIQQGKGAEVKYNGPIDCAKQLLKQGGIRSLYQGTCATLLRGRKIEVVGSSNQHFFSLGVVAVVYVVFVEPSCTSVLFLIRQMFEYHYYYPLSIQFAAVFEALLNLGAT